MDCKDARLFVANIMPAIFKGWRIRIILKKQRCAFKIQGLYRSRKARKLANSFRVAKMNQCVCPRHRDVHATLCFIASLAITKLCAASHGMRFRPKAGLFFFSLIRACVYVCLCVCVCVDFRASRLSSDQKVRYALNRIFRRNLTKCMNSWKGLVTRARRSRQLLARTMNYDLRARFQLWSEYCYKCRQARLKAVNGLHRVFKSRRCVHLPCIAFRLT